MQADAFREQDDEQLISPLHFFVGLTAPKRVGVHTVAFQELEISQERVYNAARQQLEIARNERLKSKIPSPF